MDIYIENVSNQCCDDVVVNDVVVDDAVVDVDDDDKSPYLSSLGLMTMLTIVDDARMGHFAHRDHECAAIPEFPL